MKYNIKSPMHSIDLLTHIFEFEIYELDCPTIKQVSLDNDSNIIWFNDVDFFLNRIEWYKNWKTFQEDSYTYVNLDKLINKPPADTS